jgi:hypothetical protein
MAILTGGGWGACQIPLQRERLTFESIQRPLVSILANAILKGRTSGFPERMTYSYQQKQQHLPR